MDRRVKVGAILLAISIAGLAFPARWSEEKRAQYTDETLTWYFERESETNLPPAIEAMVRQQQLEDIYLPSIEEEIRFKEGLRWAIKLVLMGAPVLAGLGLLRSRQVTAGSKTSTKG